MVRKRVPDWLNSSLWTSPPAPAEDRLVSSPSATSSAAAFADPPAAEPPVPVPPPAVTRQEPPKQETITKNSRNSSASDDSSNGSGPSPDDISRQAQLLAELSRKVINMRELRRIASQGIPDGAGIRSTVWKLLLGYLPPDRGLWSSELAKKRSQYKHFKEELLMNPSEVARKLDKSSIYDNEPNSGSSGVLARSEVTHGEHPLSLGTTSIWNKFFQDTEIIEQIDRDVMRTHPDMHFFSGDSSFAKSNQEALKNILVVFAKLNPGIRYVQGMNEILAPLFYIFRNDPDNENAASAEADTFFCFVELLSGFRDNFCQQLDNSVVGIRSTMTRLSQLLKEHDEELWRHLEVTTKVNPQFYAFRWITLLLTQEFNFADSLHIWDTLLSDPEGPQETVLRICCAMLILIRRRLLAGDFTSNLKLLQNYPSTNISHLLYVANKLRVQPST
ncbi:TBC1 domain family member 13 [Tripterygium wilfordii]|uniref:TBC1 domain family member 13 n=1 Tax=Tripterygium wilfordii TaxID=458696 RepID=A0A7J7CRC1_TRIWF|nr:TBC1 domain family member 13-like [Tripterygium wilfordii]KAF5736630.1 TBC1 domain family member 13 [Tripterygium wilfordii]